MNLWMMKMEIKSKEDFIELWEKYFSVECRDSAGNIIPIREIERDGRGKIYLKINRTSSELVCYFNPPSPSLHMSCMRNPKIPDGLVFKVNFARKIVSIYIVELKKTITNKLQEAALQLERILFFIRSLGIDRCFEMEVLLIIAYENCNKTNMSNFMSNAQTNKYLYHLYAGFLKALEGQVAQFPIKLPFCPYIELQLQVAKFFDEIELP